MALDWKTRPSQAYGDLCKDVIALQGYKPGSVPVISRSNHPKEWREWYAYYGFRKLLASQEIMRNKDEKTVPTISPFDFDAEFSLNKAPPEVPRGEGGVHREPTLEQRMRVARLYSQFSGRTVEQIAPNRYEKPAA